MRQDHQAIFSAVANKTKTFILLRLSNPQSRKFIDDENCTPKRIDCKAKTADLGKSAGLVVSPVLCPDAFSDGRMKDANKCWAEFEKVLNKPESGYSLETTSSTGRFGCIKLLGKYVYSDYDLYDIIDAENPAENEYRARLRHGMKEKYGPKQDIVQKLLNEAMLIPLVQHGAEMQYADHSNQPVDVFTPTGDYFTILREAGIRWYYENWFGGRQSGNPHQQRGPRQRNYVQGGGQVLQFRQRK